MGNIKINGEVFNALNSQPLNSERVEALLRMNKIGRVINLEARKQLVDSLTDFLLGNNAEHKVYNAIEAYNLIRKAKMATVLVADDLEKIVASDVVKTIKEIDMQTIETLSEMYVKFLPSNTRAIDNIGGKRIFAKDGIAKFMNSIAENVLEKRNDEILGYTEESLEKLRDVAYVYSFIAKYLPEPEYDEKAGKVHRPADAIVSKIAKTKLLNNLDPQNVYDIVEHLTSPLYMGADTFSPEELEKLLKQTTSILTESDIYKIDSANAIIDKYHDILYLGADSEEFRRLVDDNISLKSLALKAGSFIKNTEETNEEILQMLTGKSLGTLKSGAVDYINAEEESRYKFASIDISSSQLYHILTQVTSTLSSISPNRVLTMLRDFDSVVDKLFDGQQQTKRFKREDFYVEDYLTGNNIVALLQLTKDNTPANAKEREKQLSKYVENIRILNTIMPTSAIFEIMRNNMSILSLDSEYLKAELSAIVEECGNDRSILKDKINEFVNIRFPLKSKKENPVGKKGEGVLTSIRSGVSSSIEDVKDDYSQFEIDIDGGVHKVKTFTDELSGMSIYECLNVLKGYVDRIHRAVISNPQNESAESMRLVVGRCKKVMARMNVLIEEMQESEPDKARGFRGILREIKTGIFTKILDKCKQKMSIMGDMYNQFERGKDVHVSANAEEGTLANFVYNSKVNARNINSADTKQQVYNYLSRLERDNKETIVNENRGLNKDRIENYTNSMNSLESYSICAVTASAIEKDIMEM